MDLLDNIATELGFEFHLYVVRDQLFGSKQQRGVKDFIKSNTKSTQPSSGGGSKGSGTGGSSGIGDGSISKSIVGNSGVGTSQQQPTASDHDANDETPNSKYKDKQ